MALYEKTLKEIGNRDKNNLIEKLRGSNKCEFRKICDLLEKKYGLKPNHLMGLGTSCIVYNYDRKYVIKVCAKKIKYFHNKKHRLATDLQKTVAPLAPFLSPIEEVLYDGDEWFAYRQEKCQPLDKKHKISGHDLSDVLQIVQVMLSNGLLVGQIKPKNVGVLDKHLVLFDYHSMHPLYERIKSKVDWYHSLEEGLQCYNQLFGKPHVVNLNHLIERIKKAKNPTDIAGVIAEIEAIKKKLQ